MHAQPGWYPDPQDPSRERFWDGTAWSAESVPARRDGGSRAGYIVLAVVGGIAALLVLLAVVFGSDSDSDSDSASGGIVTTTTAISDDFALVPGTLTVVGDVVVPEGPAGEVTVVTVGPTAPTSGGAVVLVRNMTDEPVAEVSLVGTARSPSGELLDVGDAFETTPWAIAPGGWAFAHVSFLSELPPDAVIDFEVRIGGPPIRATPRSDLEITEVTFEPGADGGRLVGLVRNPHDWVAKGSFVQGVCFEGGLPTGSGGTHLGQEDLGAGEQVPFAVPVGTMGCDAFAITAYTRV